MIRGSFVRLMFAAAVCVPMTDSCSFARKAVDMDEALYANGWVLCNIRGSLVNIKDFSDGVPSLRFDPAGNMQIYTGCSIVNGTYMLIGDSVDFEFSPPPVCRNYLGNDFVQDLRGAKKIGMVKERLLIMNDSTVLMALYPK